METRNPGPEPADEIDNDPVNTPHHYRLKSGRELFDVIEEVVDDPESYHLDRLIEYKERVKKCP